MSSNIIFSLMNLPDKEYAYLYTKPINMKLGENKLKKICMAEMCIDPFENIFIFYNKAMNKLRLFSIDQTGCQDIVKVLTKGGFIVPVISDQENENVIRIEINKLLMMFR